MSSLKAFLRDYSQYGYSIPEIVEHYKDWVSDVRYMILSKWNDWKFKNDIYAVKCAKRGNDVYRFRVNRRFNDLCSMAEELVFFNPKERGTKKTRALWATLTYDAKRCSFEQVTAYIVLFSKNRESVMIFSRILLTFGRPCPIIVGLDKLKGKS